MYRIYSCTFDGCAKSYGTEGSLNQHMRNKHPEFYKQFEENFQGSSEQDHNSNNWENKINYEKWKELRLIIAWNNLYVGLKVALSNLTKK